MDTKHDSKSTGKDKESTVQLSEVDGDHVLHDRPLQTFVLDAGEPAMDDASERSAGLQGGADGDAAGNLHELSHALQSILQEADRRVFSSSPPLALSLAIDEETPEELVPYELLEPLHLPTEALYGDDLEHFYPHPLDPKDKTPSAQSFLQSQMQSQMQSSGHAVEYSQVMRAVSRSWPPSKRPTTSPPASPLSLVLPLARNSITDADLFRSLGTSDARIHPTTEFKSWALQLGLPSKIIALLEENAGTSAYELVALASTGDGLPGILAVLLGVHALRAESPHGATRE